MTETRWAQRKRILVAYDADRVREVGVDRLRRQADYAMNMDVIAIPVFGGMPDALQFWDLDKLDAGELEWIQNFVASKDVGGQKRPPDSATAVTSESGEPGG